jgi:glycosyltransferase involved in cell wall biosynthesis
MYWLAYRLPSGFVVHTRAMRDELVGRYSIPNDRVLVMEHGIEPHAGMPAVVSRSGKSGPLHLLFFGIVARYKGLDLLLEALKEIDVPFTLMIAGTSTETATLRDIRRRIAEHPAANAIRWRDEFIPEAEISRLFAAADAVVLPYRHIDQSGVLFQALRFGVPVIATQVGAFPEYVTEEIGETCPPENTSALAAALRRLHGRLGRISRQRIVEIGRRYLWPTTVRAVMPAYG